MIRKLLIFFLVGFIMFSCRAEVTKIDKKTLKIICNNINRSGYNFKPDDLPTVKNLSLHIEKIDIKYLKYLSNLNELHLTMTNILDKKKELFKLKSLTQLKKLVLNGYDFDDEDLISIENLINLEELWLLSYHLSDAGLFHLRKLTNLKTLGLHSYEMTGSGLYFLKKLKKLETFNFRGRKFSNIGMNYLSQFSQLIEVSFRMDSENHSPAFSPFELERLIKLKHLIRLELPNGNSLGSFPPFIKNLNKLEYLSFSGGPFVIDDYEFLLKQTKLKILILRNGFKIDENDLIYFQNLLELNELDLTGTKINEKVFIKLKSILPQTKIYNSLETK